MSDLALSTDDVARRAGTTYRQVDHWARQRCVTPSIADADGHGTRRRWTAADAEAISGIVRVAQDLAKLQAEGNMPIELVARIWDAWHDQADADPVVIEAGTITITLNRGGGP